MPSSTDAFTYIQDLVRQNNLEEALEHLKQIASGGTHENEVIALQRRFTSYQDDERRGIITQNDFDAKKNNLVKDILSLVDTIQEERQTTQSAQLEPAVLLQYLIHLVDRIQQERTFGDFFRRHAESRFQFYLCFCRNKQSHKGLVTRLEKEYLAVDDESYGTENILLTLKECSQDFLKREFFKVYVKNVKVQAINLLVSEELTLKKLLELKTYAFPIAYVAVNFQINFKVCNTPTKIRSLIESFIQNFCREEDCSEDFPRFIFFWTVVYPDPVLNANFLPFMNNPSTRWSKLQKELSELEKQFNNFKALPELEKVSHEDVLIWFHDQFPKKSDLEIEEIIQTCFKKVKKFYDMEEVEKYLKCVIHKFYKDLRE